MADEANSRRVVDMKPDNIRLIDQIMLRFRPIVPRPVTAESYGGVSPTMDGRKRVKRKYVRVKKKKNTHTNESSSNSWRLDLDRINGGNTTSEDVSTDPLEKVSNWISFGVPAAACHEGIMNMNMNMDNLVLDSEKQETFSDHVHGVDLTMAMEIRQRKVVESWITMEYVTGTCEDRRLLGYTDVEIWRNLETDSCPAFVSNGYLQEVVWVNQAYRRMVDLNPDQAATAGSSSNEVAVYLVVKVEKSIVAKYFPALSCRVRIEYRTSSLSSEKKMQMMVVPCDVCKMDSGDFAWRLDVKAALSLGPLF